jgi:predicted RND superfamily exporter protein
MVNRLVSPSGHVTAVNVDIIKMGDTRDEVPRMAAFARQLAADLRRRHPQIDVHLTGTMMFEDGFGQATRDDIATLVPLMILILVAIVALSLRSLMATLAALTVVLMSMLTGVGVAGWLGIPLNPGSANAPTVILTLAVADSVHILTTLLQRMRRGESKHVAIAESLRINLQAVFLTSITTAIGFLSMHFADAPPFRHLGHVVAIGVAAAFGYSVVFLPALMAVLPCRVAPTTAREKVRIPEVFADWVISHHHGIFWGTLAIVVTLAAGVLRLELNDDFIAYFNERYDIRRATDFMQDNLTGAHMIEYSLDAGAPGGINEPAYLAQVDAFASWYRSEPQVVHVNSITDVLKRVNRSVHDDDVLSYRIPNSRELAAQCLLLYELSLPVGLDLNSRINVDKSAARMTVILNDVTTEELRLIDLKAQRWLRSHWPEQVSPHGTGVWMAWAHICRRNIRSMLGASLGALALISISLIFATRSLRLGLLSLIPNLVPTVMALGLWGFLAGRIGLALSVILSLAIGIVVDDTVHFLTKYLKARRTYGMDAAGAIRYAFSSVGTAMWVTSTALAAGFSILCLSGYSVNAEMGLITATTIGFALAMDVLLLPALLLKLHGEPARPRSGETPTNDSTG